LALLTEEDYTFPLVYMRVEIELAMAEAGLGNLARATDILEQRIDLGSAGDNPLLQGLLHHARARVAFMAADEQAFARHRDETRTWFQSTGTPTLIARYQQLVLLELRAPWRPRVISTANMVRDVEV